MLRCDVSLGQADWAERLAGHIQLRTGRRIRGLAVSLHRGQVAISGLAPSFYVRQLAEQAALECLPANRLRLEIAVSPGWPAR